MQFQVSQMATVNPVSGMQIQRNSFTAPVRAVQPGPCSSQFISPLPKTVCADSRFVSLVLGQSCRWADMARAEADKAQSTETLTARKVPGRKSNVRIVIECMETVSFVVLTAICSMSLPESSVHWAKYSVVRLLMY